MDFVSVRVITHDVERLATFWEQVTGLPATRPGGVPAPACVPPRACGGWSAGLPIRRR